MKILLIAGHGAGDSGAVSTINGKTYKEAELTREMAKLLAPKLKAYGVTVTTYPTSHDAYADYKNGTLAKTANFSAYDYILEIHFNAGASDKGGNGKTTGVECLWGNRGKETGVELPMTSRIAKLGFKQRTNRAQSLAVMNTAAGYGKKANLLEVCFVDDADDIKLYNAKKAEIAQAIADGIAAYFKLKKQEVKPVAKTEQELAIEYVKSEGIMKGYDDKNFGEKDPLTRGQFAVIEYRKHLKEQEGK